MTEELRKIYEEVTDSSPLAPESITKPYKTMGEAFEEYIAVLQEFDFEWLWPITFEAGRKKERERWYHLFEKEGGKAK